MENWKAQVADPIVKAHVAIQAEGASYFAQTAAEKAAWDAVKPVAKQIVTKMEVCVLKRQRIAQSYHEAQSPYESLFSAQYKFCNLTLRAWNNLTRP